MSIIKSAYSRIPPSFQDDMTSTPKKSGEVEYPLKIENGNDQIPPKVKLVEVLIPKAEVENAKPSKADRIKILRK